ncbi:hypothetical protein BH11PLA2_BH11PLA2_09590 [soil metagenome]
MNLNYSGPDQVTSAAIPLSRLFTAESVSLASASNAINLVNSLAISGANTLDLVGGAFTQVQFNAATFASGSSLAITTAAGQIGKTVRIAGPTQFGLGVTLGLTGDGTNGANLAFDGIVSDGGNATTITKTGNGRLSFNNSTSANTLLAGTTLDIQAGTLVLNGSSVVGSFNPIGSAGIQLSGGNVVLDSKVGNLFYQFPTSYVNNVTLTANATIQSIVTGGSFTFLGGGGSTIAIGSNTLKLDAIRGGNPVGSLGANLIIGGDLTGNGTINLISTGVGTLTITPVNGNVGFTGNNSGFTGTVNIGTIAAQFLSTTALGGITNIVPGTGGTLQLLTDGNGTGQLQTFNYGGAGLTTAGNLTVVVGRFGSTYAPIFTTAQNKTIQLTSTGLFAAASVLTVTNNNQYGLDFTGNVSVPAGYTFNVATATASNITPGLTLSGVVTGTGFIKAGLGTMILSNAGNLATLTGNISISGTVAGSGVLGVTSDEALGALTNQIIINNGTNTGAAQFQAFSTFTTDRTFVFGHATNTLNIIGVSFGSTLTVTSALTGANGFQKGDSGMLVLAPTTPANSTITGAVTVSGGILSISDANALGSASLVTVVANEGTAFQLNNSITFGRPITLAGSTGMLNNGQVENVSGSNTLSGLVTLTGSSTIGNSLSGSTLTLTGGVAQAALALTFNGVGDVNVSTTAMTGTVAANIIRNGTGTTNISVANAGYLGLLTANQGTLILSDQGSIGTGTGAVTVTSFGTFRIDNTIPFTNRLATTHTMNLTNGTFRISGSSTNAIAETLGALTSTWGANKILTEPDTQTLTVTYTSLAGNAVNGGSVLTFQSGLTGAGTVFGDIANQVFFTTSPTLTPATTGIIPRAIVFDNTGGSASYNFASYNHNGVASNLLGVQAFTGYNTGNNLDTALVTETLQLTSATPTFSNSRTLNALAFNGTVSLNTTSYQQTLLLTSAQILVQSGAATIGDNVIIAGAGTEFGVNIAPSSSLTVNAPFTGTANFTKSLGGSLTFGTRQFFNTGASTFTILDGTVNLPANTDNALFSGLVAAGTNQNLAIGGNGILNLNGNVQQVGDFRHPNNNNFNGNGGAVMSSTAAVLSTRNANANWAGVISGPVTFVMSNTAPGNVERFYNDNTYTGRTGIMGGTLELTDLGKLSGTTGIDINYGTLNILNTSAQNGRFNLTDRVPSVDINLRGGFLLFAGRAQSASTETLGNINLAQGASNLNVTTGGVGINSSVLTIASLNQSSPDAVVNLNGAGGQLGSTARLIVTNRETTPGLVNNIIGGWAVNGGAEFLSYIPTLGIAAVNAAGFPGYTNTVFPTVSEPTSNIRITVAATLPAGGLNINALSYQIGAAATLAFAAPTDVLNLTSGGLVKATAFVLTFGGTPNSGRLTAGGSTPAAGTQYLYIHNTAAVANNITMNSVIQDNDGTHPVRLVFTGFNGGALVLNGLNTYSGGTAVNGWNGSALLGTLTVGATGTLPAGGITLNNGILTQTAGGTIVSTNSVNLNGSSTMTLVGANALVDLNFDNNGGNTAPTVNTGGLLSLTGTITATGSNTATTAIINGSLDFGGNAKTFTINPLSYNSRNLNLLQPTLNIAAVITNTGAISITGGGRLQLSGLNTFTGGVNVDGTSGVILGTSSSGFAGSVNNGPLGTGTLTLAAGATVSATTNLGINNALIIQGNANFDGLSNIFFGGDISLPATPFTVNIPAPQMTVGLFGSFILNPATAITKTGFGILALGSGYGGAINLPTGGSLSLLDDGDGTGSLQNISYNSAITSGGATTLTVGRLGIVYSPYFTTASNKTIRVPNINFNSFPLTVNNTGGYGLQLNSALTLANTQTFNVVNATNSNTVPGLTVSGKISGTFGITKIGLGTLQLNNATNDFVGLIDITEGVVAANSDGALGDLANGVRLNRNLTTGVGFRATGSFATSRAFTLNQTFNAIEVETGSTLTMNTAFTIPVGTNQLIKNDNGTLVLAASNSPSWTGASITAPGTLQVLTGGVLLNAGTLRLENATALGDSTNIVAVNATTGAVVQIAGGINVQNSIVLNTQLTNNYFSGINFSGALQSVGANVTNTWSGGISGNQDAVITADSLNVLEITGGINQNVHLFVYGGAGTINVTTNSIISVHTFDKVGSGTVNLQVNTATGTSGGTRIFAGTLKFSGNNGVMTAGTVATQILPGATLTLDNTTASGGTVNVNSRLGGNTRPVTFVGGTLNIIGNETDTLSFTEAIAGATFNRGQSVITLSPGTTAGAGGVNFNFTAANNPGALQSASPSGATALIRGLGLGTTPGANIASVAGTTTGFTFAGQTGATATSNKSIIPWLVVDTDVLSSNLGFSFGTTDAANAATTSGTAILRPLTYVAGSSTVNGTGSEYSNINTFVANSNTLVDATSGDLVGVLSANNAAAINLNSITFGANRKITLLPLQVLTLSSGGILDRANTTGQSTSIDGGILSAPGGGTPLVFHVIGTGTTSKGISSLTSNITGGSAGDRVGLVKAGDGDLIISTTKSTIPGLTALSNNTLVLQTVVNQGKLILNGGTNTLGASNFLEVGASATLELNGNSQYVSGLFTDGTYNGVVDTATAGGIITNTRATLNSTLVTNSDARNWAGTLTGKVFYNRTGSVSTTTIYTPQTYTLGTLINGGTVSLRDYGRLANTSAIDLNYASLQLDNTQAAGISGRLNTAATLTMRGGILIYIGRAQTASTETLGPISIAEGYNIIEVRAGGGPAAGPTGINSAVLTAASLTRPAGSSATAYFQQANGTVLENGQIGSTPRLVFTTPPTLSNFLIGPWAVANREWASYIPSFGVGLLNANGFAGYAVNPLTGSPLPTENIRILNANTTLVGSGTLSINTLNIQYNGNQTLDLGGQTLELRGGGLIVATGTQTVTETITNGTITSGTLNVGGDLYIHTLPYAGIGRNVALNALISDNGTGVVRLIVTSTELAVPTPNVITTTATNLVTINAANNYSGGTVLNGGNTIIGNAGVIPFSTAGVTLNAASLSTFIAGQAVAGQGTITATNTVTINGPSFLNLVNSTTLANLVFNNNGATAAGAAATSVNYNPTINTFIAGLGVDGKGTLTLTGNVTATSSNVATTSIIVGRVDLGSADRTFTVDPIIVGDNAVAPLQATLALQGVVGTGGIIKNGLGTLQFNGQATFSGTVTVNAGGINFGTLGNTGLPAGNAPGSRFATIDLMAGTRLNLTNTDITIGGLNGSGTVFNASPTGAIASSRTFNFGFNNADTAFSGTFARFSDASLTSFQVNKMGTGNFSFTGTGSTIGVTAAISAQVSQGTWTYSGAGTGTSIFGTMIVLPTGTLTLDNSGVIANNVNNRLGGARVLNASATATILQLNGGTFRIIGNANTPTSETVGSLTLTGAVANSSGAGIISLEADPAQPLTLTIGETASGTGATAVVALGSLSAVANGSTVLIRGLSSTTGNGLANVLLAGTAVLGAPTGSGAGLNGTTVMPIRPDILGDTTTGVTAVGTGFVTRDTDTGFLRVLAPSELAITASAGANNATVNFSLATAQQFYGANSQLGSVVLTTGGSVVLHPAVSATQVDGLPMQTTINTGGVLATAAQASFGTGRITTNNNIPFFFHTPANVTTGGVLFANTGGLTKDGAGTLTLGFRNLYQSQTILLGGQLTLAGGSNTLPVLQTGGAPTLQSFSISGGTLELNGNSQAIGTLFNNTSARYADQTGIITNSGTLATLTTNSGSVFTNPVSIRGAINFTKTGNNALSLSSVSTYTGVTNIRANSLTLIDAGALTGTTSVNVNYASLILDQSGLNPAGNLNPVRINPAAVVTLNGGTLQLNSGGSVDSSATFATLNVTQGHNTINVPQAPISGHGSITIGNLVLNADATINLTGGTGGFFSNLPGLNQSQLFINAINGTAIATLATANRSLGGNIIANNGEFVTNVDAVTTGANGVNYGIVTLNGTTGPLGTLPTIYTSNIATLPASAAASNVRLTTAGSVAVPAAGATYNVLALRAAGITLTFTGTTALNLVSGGLALTSNTAVIGAAVGSGTLTSGGATTNLASRLYVHNTGAIINSAIINNGATGATTRLVTNTISGTLTIAGNNTYTGGTVIGGAGTTAFTNATAGSIKAGGITINNSTMTAATVSGQITSQAVTINGGGVLTLGTAAGTFTNTLTSLIFNNNGGTATPAVNVLGVAGASLTLTGGTTAITSVNDNMATVPTIAGTAATSVLIFNPAATITVNTTAANVPNGLIISAAIGSGTVGAITKAGTGTLVLSQANTFTTGFNLNAGGVVIGNAAAFGTGTLTLAAGTSLMGSAAFTVTNPITINGTGTIIFGASAANSFASAVAANGVTLNGAVTFGTVGDHTFEVNSHLNTSTLGGTLGTAAANNIIKTGPGTLVLSNAANPYSGTTTINGGVLSATLPGSFGTSTAVGSILFGGGILQHGGTNLTDYSSRFSTAGNQPVYIDTLANVVTYNTAIEGAGTSLGKFGAGTLILTATSTYTGVTLINQGTLQVGTGATAGLIPVANDILNAGILNWFKSDDTTLSGIISGGGSIVKRGAGDLKLTGVNTFSGNVTLNAATPAVAGTITITNSSSLGIGPKTVSIVDNNGAATITGLRLDGSGGNITLAANISFSTSNASNHGAIRNLAGDNVILGNFTLTSGGGSTSLIVDGGTLTMAAGATYTPNTTLRSLILGGQANGFLNGILQDQNATNFVGLTKQDAGTWTVNGSNTYTGVTNLNGGILNVATLADTGVTSSIGFGSNPGNATNLVLNGGTLQYKGATPQSTNRAYTLGTNGGTFDASGSVTTATLSLTNTDNITLTGTDTARALTLTGTNTSANTLAGALADNGLGASSINKTGAGTWTLTAASTYTGNTTVTGGTLILTGTASHAASTLITVGTTAGSTAVLNTSGLTAGGANFSANGYTLAAAQTLAGHGNVVSSIGFSSPAATTISPGTSGVGTLTITGNSKINGSYNFDLAVAGTGSLFPTPIANGGSSSLPTTNHDVLAIIGTVDVSGLIFNISSLGTTGFDITGQTFYSWTALTSTGGLTGTPVLTPTVSGVDFLAALTNNPGSVFQVIPDANNVYVNFIPAGAVPEPALMGLAAFGVLAFLRRRNAAKA